MGSRGERKDTSGPAVRALLEGIGIAVDKYEIVSDEKGGITQRLRAWSGDGLALIVTTGGTGLSPRDVTPQATKEAIDYEVPGIAEAMRAEGLKHTPMSMISRGLAGVRGRTLIVNLPGSEKGARESLAVVLPALLHALALLSGAPSEH